jgi:hypothetical protein
VAVPAWQRPFAQHPEHVIGPQVGAIGQQPDAHLV